MQRLTRHTGRVQDAYSLLRNSRSLLRRLCQDGVTRYQCRRHLPHKNLVLSQ